MVTEWMIYWITRCDALHGIFCTFSWLLFVGGVLTLIISAILHDAGKKVDWKKVWRYTISMLVGSSFNFLLWGFIPTTKEMCAIIVIPAIVRDENVQNLGTELVDLARDWMIELKPKKGKHEEKD